MIKEGKRIQINTRVKGPGYRMKEGKRIQINARVNGLGYRMKEKGFRSIQG